MSARNPLTLFTACVALIVLPSVLFAQERERATIEGLAPQRVFVTHASDTAQPAKLAAIVEFLKLEIESESRLVVVPQETDADVILALSAVATRNGFDVIGTATGRPSGVAGPKRTARVADLNVSTARRFIIDIVKALDAAYPPVAIKVSEIVTERVVQNTEVRTTEQGVTLTVFAPAGVTLILPEDERATVDENGVWSRELPQNASFAYRAELPGFVPRSRLIFMGTEDVRDELELRPLDHWRFGLDIRYVNLILAPQAEWYWVPGSVFLSAGIESSFLAIVPSYERDYKPLFRYIDLEVGGGLDLGKLDATLRPSLTLGLASRLDVGPGLFRFSDYGAVSMRTGLRINWAIAGPFTAFTELNSRLALVLVPEGVDPSLNLDALPKGLRLFDGHVVLEMPTLFFGGRYGL